jgi:diguanylate cyclase (GGDEF)-like protein/PAS domain S-box-containing protein
MASGYRWSSKLTLGRDISDWLAAEEALQKSQAKFAAIFSLTPEPMTLTRLADGLVLDVSRSTAEYWGCPREQLVGRTSLPDDIGFWTDAKQRSGWMELLRRDGEVLGFEMQVRRKGGTTATVLMHSRIMDMDGEPCVISNIHDMSVRLAAEEALRKSEAKFAALFSLTPDPTALTRLADGKVLDGSRCFAEFFGYARDEAIGRSTLPGDLGIWVDGEHRRKWKDALERYGEVHGFETSMRRKDGSIVTALVSGKVVAMGGEQCVIAAAHDITEQKQHAEHLEQLAHHDPLTGLPNRLLLGDRLRQTIAQSQRAGTRVAVCCLDLDGFKAVNDSLGHEAGDQVLVEVANRLVACVRGGDTVARLGGDEFVILLSGLAADEECRMTLVRLLRTVSMPYSSDGGEPGGISGSMGVTMFPSDPADPDTLLRHADHAMYAAKQAGKNRFQMFDARLDQRFETRHSTLRCLGEALALGQFRLHYQPQVDCRQGRVVGAEALIRWQHPTLGLLLPSEFVPLIEDADLAPSVGEWVIREVLSQTVAWHREGIDLRISVNAFVHQLLQPGFAGALAALLAQHPAPPPGCLRLEIFGGGALKELDCVRQVIEDCQALGIQFSLHDFGTGCTTLAELRLLPATEIKIDQSLVGRMLAQAEDLAIVEAIIGMSRAFNRSVVAEGVETPAQINRLLALGCDVMQGYALAHPMPADDISRWLREFRPDPAWQQTTGGSDGA